MNIPYTFETQIKQPNAKDWETFSTTFLAEPSQQNKDSLIEAAIGWLTQLRRTVLRDSVGVDRLVHVRRGHYFTQDPDTGVTSNSEYEFIGTGRVA